MKTARWSLIMKLVRFQQKTGENRVGAMVDSSHFVEVPVGKGLNEPLVELLRDSKAGDKVSKAVDAGAKLLKSGKNNAELFEVDKANILPPVGRPSKIICSLSSAEGQAVGLRGRVGDCDRA